MQSLTPTPEGVGFRSLRVIGGDICYDTPSIAATCGVPPIGMVAAVVAAVIIVAVANNA